MYTFGWNTIVGTVSLWLNTHRHSRRLICHNRTWWSILVARRNKFLDHANSVTTPSWPLKTNNGFERNTVLRSRCKSLIVGNNAVVVVGGGPGAVVIPEGFVLLFFVLPQEDNGEGKSSVRPSTVEYPGAELLLDAPSWNVSKQR